MRKLAAYSLAFLVAASTWMVACGNSADDTKGDEVGSGSTGSGSKGNGTGGVDLGTGGINLATGGNGLGGDGPGSWEGEACADGNSGGNLEPIYLVFLLDQSGSMGDCFDHLDVRWKPVVSAMNAFFADQNSAGLYASLTLFPTEETAGETCPNSSANLKCDAGSYDSPVVEPTKLPNSTVFADAMDVYPNEYGTPTYAALAGTVTYAKSLKDEGKKVAIVMVTDGEPQFCGNSTPANNIANTAGQAAEAKEAGIPTYVLGVGDSLDDLDEIASQGGTTEAFLIDPSEADATPEKTQQALLAKINEIRGAQASCVMNIPAPPEGKTLDPAKVNVEYTTGGKTTRLAMNADCSGEKQGWHYDDDANPTKIELCSATCTDVKAHDDAAINVVFGCEVRIDVK